MLDIYQENKDDVREAHIDVAYEEIFGTHSEYNPFGAAVDEIVSPVPSEEDIQKWLEAEPTQSAHVPT
jgi:hypothetical protein